MGAGRDVVTEIAHEAPEVGWASSTMERAITAGLLRGLAIWQVVMVGAVLATPEAGATRWPLVGGHVAIGGLSLAVERRRVPPWVLLLVTPALLVADWAVMDDIESVLCLAAAWMGNVAHALPAFLERGRRSLAGSALLMVGLPVGITVVHPDRLGPIALTIAVTATAMRVATVAGRSFLERFGGSVDEVIAATWEERRTVAMARAASDEAAEQARTLHDTVINTLGAVASGGGALRDVALVQDLCGRDLRTLDAILDGVDPDPGLDLDGLVVESGLDVRRLGLPDDRLEAVAEAMPADAVRAMHGAVREALRNVAKHAGTMTAELDVAVDDGRLVVTVADHGVGFDGELVPGRGLAESVFGRVAQAGLRVDLETAPGSGTSVRLVHVFAEPVESGGSVPAEPEGTLFSVVALQHRARTMWVVAVLVVGVVIEVVNRFGQLTWTYGMLGVGALSWAVARRDLGAGRPLGTATSTFVVLCVPVGFLLSVAAIDFGRHEVIQIQAIGITVPLVILLVDGRTLRPLASALGLLILTAVAATVAVAQTSTGAAAVLPVAAAPAIVLTAGWAIVQRTIGTVGEQAALEQQAAAEARVELAAREAAGSARLRWQQAGLHGCRSLVSDLAVGAREPTDPATREACGEEERYLRQVVLLEPELFRMGPWCARALADARRRGVRLTVRTGARDVADDATAAALGALLVDAVADAAPGSELTASLFLTGDQLRFALVGPALAARAARWVAPPRWRATVQAYGDVDVVEVTRS